MEQNISDLIKREKENNKKIKKVIKEIKKYHKPSSILEIIIYMINCKI